MTERALPGIGVGVRSRPEAAPSPHTAARSHVGVDARPVTARRETLLTTPARAGMLVGASAAVYALALAGISGLQAEADAAVTAARAPYQEALAQTRAANDELAARILKAEAETRALTGTYGKVGVSIEAYQSRLEALAALVAEVQGSAAALPARIKLPTVTMRGAVAGSSQSGGGSTTPRTSAKTGASGGLTPSPAMPR